MKVDGVPYRTIWLAEDGWRVKIIDQRELPHKFVITSLETVDDAVNAIKDMWVRGAPLIGATAAYGVALAMRADPSNKSLETCSISLLAARPTAVNLKWAVDRMVAKLAVLPEKAREEAAYYNALQICNEDIDCCSKIGNFGSQIIKDIWEQKDRNGPVNILTHCNAGWLATVDWGTALAPIYKSHEQNIPIHVWVDETRPRNQGSYLTAWELGKEGIDHTIIVDNVGGHLMQHGLVDMCITGTDRTTFTGDVCNKIGTYLKALAAKDNQVPFYVGLPSSTIDWGISDGISEIPIEERDVSEVEKISGLGENGDSMQLRITPSFSKSANYAFDVTPGRLITGLITEKGICEASETGLRSLFGN